MHVIGFDWGFTTCGIGDQGFYGGTCNPQSYVKQIWERMFWQSTCIPFIFDTLDFLAPNIFYLLRRV